MTDDRREDPRLPILGELHGEIMVFQPITIAEIGSSGAQIETSFPLHLDSLHDVRLTLGDRSVVVKARIAHSCISDVDQERVVYRSGIEFVELSDHARRAIEAFVETLQQSRRDSGR